MTLVLASQSPARRRMLEAAGVSFTATSAPLDEEKAKADVMASGATPSALAERLAAAKALSVAAAPDALVIGSDQVLETPEGEALSKPRSHDELRVQLLGLRGKVHRLHSAAAVVAAGRPVWQAVETVSLAMRDFGDSFLDDYLAREYEAVRGNVGGYRIEGLGAQLFERIEGSHFAILGMPLLPLLAFLRTKGVIAR